MEFNNYLKEMGKTFSKGLTFGLGIAVIVGLMSAVYAFTTPLSQVTTGSNLTAQYGMIWLMQLKEYIFIMIQI